MKTLYLLFRSSSFLVITAFLVCCEATEREQNESGMEESVPTEETSIEYSDGLLGDLERGINSLKNEEGSEVLEEIEPINFILYLSGYFNGSSHAHSCLSFNPDKQTIMVSGFNYKEEFEPEQLSEAVEQYKILLTDKGEVPGVEVEEEEMETVEIDGVEMIYIDADDLKSEGPEAEEQFTSEQWDFLYSHVAPSQGYSFISGIGDESRDYPLIYTSGYMESAELNLVSKDFVMELPYAEMDSIFQEFERIVEKRLK